MTDTMRSVADFALGMIGQCGNLDELTAVERNPSFIRRMDRLKDDAALFGEATNAMDAKRSELVRQHRFDRNRAICETQSEAAREPK